MLRSERGIPLAYLAAGTRGVIRGLADSSDRTQRLAALGVTAGARVRVLQTFPGIIFQCDQTELVVERDVARAILVDVEDA